MLPASLGVGAPAWRAARAAAALGAVARSDMSADDALGQLMQVGSPDAGWLEVMGQARQAISLAMLLPRPGDPRGIAWPRGVMAEAAVGWGDDHASTWLVPAGERAWSAVVLPDQGVPTRDAVEADRLLRIAVVDVAHMLDELDLPDAAPLSDSRQAAEATVDAWALGPGHLPAPRRRLASLGLRMLLAVEGARSAPSPPPGEAVAPLEAAARTAVEAAYSMTRSPG